MQHDMLRSKMPFTLPSDPSAMVLSNGDMMDQIETRALTKNDYDEIVRVIDKWWGGPTNALAHPVYFYELGGRALVAECDGKLVGFLLGFVAEKGPTGYVHLVGIDPRTRRQGVGSRLYRDFEASCQEAGCAKMKAVTTLGNEGSRRFHEALDWREAHMPHYAGRDRARLVFTKGLEK